MSLHESLARALRVRDLGRDPRALRDAIARQYHARDPLALIRVGWVRPHAVARRAQLDERQDGGSRAHLRPDPHGQDAAPGRQLDIPAAAVEEVDHIGAVVLRRGEHRGSTVLRAHVCELRTTHADEHLGNVAMVLLRREPNRREALRR